MCTTCPLGDPGGEKVLELLELGVAVSCQVGPLPEQQVLSAPEPALQPPVFERNSRHILQESVGLTL